MNANAYFPWKLPYSRTVVATLYLAGDQAHLPGGLQRLVVVVFAYRSKREETFIAYGVDPDKPRVVFRFELPPTDLRAVLEITMQHLALLIDTYNAAIKGDDREQKLSFHRGTLWRPIDKLGIAKVDEDSVALDARKPRRKAKGTLSPGGVPRSLLSAGPEPKPCTIVIPGKPPEDTSPKALAYAAAIDTVSVLAGEPLP
jgi:hypothetical protein